MENMGYKIFYFSIKITPLELTKIWQHKDCTVVKPKMQNFLYKKKIHSQCFPKSNYNHKDLWSSSKYKIKKSIQHNFIAACFSQNHACIFYKRYLHIQNVTFLTFTTFTSHLILYIITTQRLGLRILEKSLGFNTCI